MKERPILFSVPMVMAILEGRKTQTRRIVKDTGLYAIEEKYHGKETARRELANLATQCKYGKPGDRLWVRETWRTHEMPNGDDGILFRADGSFVPIENTAEAAEKWCAVKRSLWRPSIFMPRWASRITLEITGVRVERLQDISSQDAIKEGIGITMRNEPGAVQRYAEIWESINGPGSWAENPFVWVIEFRRIKP